MTAALTRVIFHIFWNKYISVIIDSINCRNYSFSFLIQEIQQSFTSWGFNSLLQKNISTFVQECTQGWLTVGMGRVAFHVNESVCRQSNLKDIKCTFSNDNLYHRAEMLVYCNQNEAGHQTIKATGMCCWDAASPWKKSLAFIPQDWWNRQIKWIKSVSVGSYENKNQVNGESFA